MSVRLFVGNLPYSATEVDIRQHFGTVGDPMQIVIPDRSRHGQAPRICLRRLRRPRRGRARHPAAARPAFQGTAAVGERSAPARSASADGAGGFSGPRPPMGGGATAADGRRTSRSRRRAVSSAARRGRRTATSARTSRRKGGAVELREEPQSGREGPRSAQRAAQRPHVQRRGGRRFRDEDDTGVETSIERSQGRRGEGRGRVN